MRLCQVCYTVRKLFELEIQRRGVYIAKPYFLT